LEIKLFHVHVSISTKLLYNAEWNRRLPAAHCTQMTCCEMDQMYITRMKIIYRQQAHLFHQTICKWCHSSHFSI